MGFFKLIVLQTLCTVVWSQAYNGQATPNYRVLGIVNPPFINAADSSGEFSGVTIDLLDAMAAAGRFTYTFSLHTDSSYGRVLPNGTTTGALGQLVANNTDIAALDASVTQARESVVDFLIPFYQSQTRIVVNVADNFAHIKYAVFAESTIASYLQTSKIPRDQAIWANIQANLPGSLVANDAAGIALVLQGGYAYLLDTPDSQLRVREHPGVLALRPEIILTKYYAFAVQQGSPIRESLNLAYLSVLESGRVQQLSEQNFPH